jgi:hypothetical protein
MAAGDYTVCVRSFDAAQSIAQYHLNISIVGATN